MASVGLLTVSALLSAFLFGLMLQVADRAATWADSAPERGRATSDHATYLAELAANAGYASLVSILTSVAFVVASTSHGWVLRVAAALGLGLGSHLVLTLLMVMKRVFNLTLQRLRIARTTGASPRDHPPPARVPSSGSRSPSTGATPGSSFRFFRFLLSWRI